MILEIERIIVEMIGVLLEVLVTYTYFETVLLKNRKFGKKTLLFYLGMFIVLSILHCTVKNMIVTPTSLAAAIFIMSWAYYGEWKNKLSLSLLLTIIFVLSELGTGMVMSMIYSESVHGMENNLILYFQGMFTSMMVAFIVVKTIVIYKNRHHYSLPAKFWLGIMLIPVTSIVCIYSIVEVAYKMNDLHSNIHILIIAFFLILANVFVFYLFENELKLQEEKVKYRYLDRQLENQRDYYNELANSQKDIQRTAHDLKNALISISGKLSSGDIGSAQKKIQDMIAINKRDLQTVYTGNLTIDTMLNLKHKRIVENGIRFNPICIMSKDLRFDDISFCILLGNAIDNAIEACEKIPEDKRYIVLKLIQRENFLSCYIENSMDGNMPAYGNKTLKKDKFRHGFGIENMNAIIQQNGGNMDVTIKENTYCVCITYLL